MFFRRKKQSPNDRLAAIAQQVSHRLHMRYLEPLDVHFLVEMASDPTAAAANGWSGDEVTAVRRRFADPDLFEKTRASEIVAIERDTDKRVGTATFSSDTTQTTNATNGDAFSIGIHVHADERGQGYGREIMAAAIMVLQHTTAQIVVGTATTNLAMRRIMEQLGYAPHPGTREYPAPNGNRIESVWFDCSASAGPPRIAHD